MPSARPVGPGLWRRPRSRRSLAAEARQGGAAFLIVYADNDFTGLDRLAEAMASTEGEENAVTVAKIDDRDRHDHPKMRPKPSTTQAALKFISTEKPRVIAHDWAELARVP